MDGGLIDLAREFGPVAALVLFLVWNQARQGSKLVDAVLDEVRGLREAFADAARLQAKVVAELGSIRESLDGAKATVQVVSERSTEQGQVIAVQGAQIRELTRRMDLLERIGISNRAN